jgi:hypothetical protein
MSTVSPQELGQFLDAVSSAPVALRDVPRIGSILAKLVGLANQPYHLSAQDPDVTMAMANKTFGRAGPPVVEPPGV